MQTITPNELQDRDAQQTVDLVDVRTPGEFRTEHVRGARSIPLDRISAQAIGETRPSQAAGPTYVICKSGSRARQAIDQLARTASSDGVDTPALDLVLVEGGTDAAIAAGLDTVRGKAVMSLERQVRIAAGSLVALGVLGGVVLTPWLLILPTFVGCGLVFAGLTNTCGMGLLLARMPWNR